MSDETDWALALSRRDGGHIVQGLPLPQPEGGRRLIVLTVNVVLLLDGSARVAATLKV